ncbi:hypothetical protein ACWDTI_03855 [Gordonia sp. NPDC003424]
MNYIDRTAHQGEADVPETRGEVLNPPTGGRIDGLARTSEAMDTVAPWSVDVGR